MRSSKAPSFTDACCLFATNSRSGWRSRCSTSTRSTRSARTIRCGRVTERTQSSFVAPTSTAPRTSRSPRRSAIWSSNGQEPGRRARSACSPTSAHGDGSSIPIACYWCWDAGDSAVQALVADVTSTPWHGRHAYVLEHSGEEQWFDKELHVSPFLSMDQRYRITASVPDERVTVRIESHTDDGLVLEAGLTGTTQPITRHSLGRLLWRHPMLTAACQLASTPRQPGSRSRARPSTAIRVAARSPAHREADREIYPRGRSVDCARARPAPRLGNAGDRRRGRHTPRLRHRRTDGRSSRARRPRVVSRSPPWVDRSRRVLRTGLVGL